MSAASTPCHNKPHAPKPEPVHARRQRGLRWDLASELLIMPEDGALKPNAPTDCTFLGIQDGAGRQQVRGPCVLGMLYVHMARKTSNESSNLRSQATPVRSSALQTQFKKLHRRLAEEEVEEEQQRRYCQGMHVV